MADSPWFEPDRVAYYEAAGWRAYYDHRWLKIVSLIAGLCREQFKIPFPQSLLAAAFIVRASIAWVPVEHDAQRVSRNLSRFYRLARRYSPLDFDPVRVAELEVRYWDDHRRMAGRPDVEKHGYVETVTELHGALFGLPHQMARTSAELRVVASNIVDRITSGVSTDVEADWQALEEHLRQCYRVVHGALVAHAEPTTP